MRRCGQRSSGKSQAVREAMLNALFMNTRVRCCATQCLEGRLETLRVLSVTASWGNNNA